MIFQRKNYFNLKEPLNSLLSTIYDTRALLLRIEENPRKTFNLHNIKYRKDIRKVSFFRGLKAHGL
jgi:hypothetical protein